jgi:hypothetical protein
MSLRIYGSSIQSSQAGSLYLPISLQPYQLVPSSLSGISPVFRRRFTLLTSPFPEMKACPGDSVT